MGGGGLVMAASSKTQRRFVVFSAVLVLWICLVGQAQNTTGRLETIVKDTSGAVIPGATVTAINEGTNISYTSPSSDSGLSVFNLPPGTYTVTSELQGFKRYVGKGV